ncbi:hypothetical protein HYR99_26270 [Candidatus Poribacteria bacterium]|nr:hypothetical protein [Candidatus Poribacteria bacterium]
MREKIIHWLIFSVLLALTPIGINCIFTFTIGKIPTLATLFSKGELLLISAILTGRAIGELVTRDGTRRIAKLLTGGACVIILIFASAWFGLMSAGIPTNTDFVSWSSIVVFATAVLVSGWCILLTERER